MSLVDDWIALNYTSLKNHEDPKRLFEQIKELETSFNTKINKIIEVEKMGVVLSQAPVACHSALTN